MKISQKESNLILMYFRPDTNYISLLEECLLYDQEFIEDSKQLLEQEKIPVAII